MHLSDYIKGIIITNSILFRKVSTINRLYLPINLTIVKSEVIKGLVL